MRNIGQAMARSTARSTIVAGLLVAGLVHLALTPEHIRASSILGIGFFSVAVLQLSLGSVLLLGRRLPGLEPAALIVVVVSLSMYVISRTIGLSFGHTHANHLLVPELICKSAEFLVAGALTVRSLSRRAALTAQVVSPRTVYRAFHPLSLAALGVLAALALVFVAGQLTSSQSHVHAADDGHPTTLSARELQQLDSQEQTRSRD